MRKKQKANAEVSEFKMKHFVHHKDIFTGENRTLPEKHGDSRLSEKQIMPNFGGKIKLMISEFLYIVSSNS